MKRVILCLLVLCVVTGCRLKNSELISADIPADGDIYFEYRNENALMSAFSTAVDEWTAGLDKKEMISTAVGGICVDDLLLDDARNAKTASNTDLKILVTLSSGAEGSTLKASELLDSFKKSISGEEINARLHSAALELRDSSGKLIGYAGDYCNDTDAVPVKRENRQIANLITQSEDELHAQTLTYEFCLGLDNAYYSQNESFFGYGNFWLRRFGIEEGGKALDMQIVNLIPPLDQEKRDALEADLSDIADQVSEYLLKDEKSMGFLRSRGAEEIRVTVAAVWSEHSFIKEITSIPSQ